MWRAMCVCPEHVGAIRGEPAWVEEGCRRGRVAPIGDEDGAGAGAAAALLRQGAC